MNCGSAGAGADSASQRGRRPRTRACWASPRCARRRRLPDINVIAPITGSDPRADRPCGQTSTERPARAGAAPEPARRLNGAGRNRTPAAPATAAPAAPRAVGPTPAAIDRDKVPSNTEVLTSADFDHDASPSLLDALGHDSARRFAERPVRQSVPARPQLSRLRRLAGAGNAAGPCGLPERRAHQRVLWRHRQLGLHPGNGDQPPVAGAEQSDLRPQRHRRRADHRDEERLHLSGQGSRGDVRLLRAPHRPAPRPASRTATSSAYITADAINDDGWRRLLLVLAAAPHVYRPRRPQRSRPNSTSTSPAPTTSSARSRRPRSRCSIRTGRASTPGRRRRISSSRSSPRA